MAQQQQVQRAPLAATGEGATIPLIQLSPIIHRPDLFYDAEGKQYYKVAEPMIANSSPITVLPSTTFTFTQTSLAIRPSLLKRLKLIGHTNCMGEVFFTLLVNGNDVFMHENSVLPVPPPQPFGFIQGVLEYELNPPVYPPKDLL
ncbi:MAG: hypothetical protein RBG13Loki_1842 [Promethearchaeota archaeon CR_4]|nr:MAG: hypothetical protein RBG13Loki_1842 [Candidatus Lokiarchaeota archaeon CR_4]